MIALAKQAGAGTGVKLLATASARHGPRREALPARCISRTGSPGMPRTPHHKTVLKNPGLINGRANDNVNRHGPGVGTALPCPALPRGVQSRCR